MQTLLTVLMTWLSINAGLPAVHQHPGVEFVSATKMEEVRKRRLTAAGQADAPRSEALASNGAGHGVHGIYDDQGQTIYLPQGWTAASPADLSVLIHELAHHVQSVSKLRYDCAGAREKLAYEAQSRWLALFDKNLADEFQLDAMTILVRSNCMR